MYPDSLYRSLARGSNLIAQYDALADRVHQAALHYEHLVKRDEHRDLSEAVKNAYGTIDTADDFVRTNRVIPQTLREQLPQALDTILNS